MTTLTAHPDKALKSILKDKVTVVAGHYEDRIISVYAHGEMPTDKLPDEFIRIECNGSIKTRTNPIGYLYGNLAVTVYVKAQGNGVVKNNRIDSILEQLQGIDGAVSEGFHFRLSPDNIIAPTYIDPSSNYSLTVINVEWHTV